MHNELGTKFDASPDLRVKNGGLRATISSRTKLGRTARIPGQTHKSTRNWKIEDVRMPDGRSVIPAGRGIGPDGMGVVPDGIDCAGKKFGVPSTGRTAGPMCRPA